VPRPESSGRPRSAVLSAGLWVLDQFGLGNGHEGETAGIRDQLGQIQNDLTEVLAATRELRAEVAQSEYSLMVSETSRITARIDKGMDDLHAVAKMAKGDPTRKEFTEATLTFIGDELMKGQQEELAKRITGEAGSDGLIVAASKVAKTRSPCCWTARTSEHVRQVLDYYQLEEARLLLLRVEYMHAHRSTYSGAEITRQIEKVAQELGAPETPGTQEAVLKPSSPCCASATYAGAHLPVDIVNPLIAEPGSKLIWNTAYLGAQMPPAYSLYTQRAEQAGGWRVATAAEVHKLIAGWHGANWANWLDGEVGGQIGSIKAVFVGPSGIRPFSGVWTYTTTLCATCSPAPGTEFNAVNATGSEERGTSTTTFKAARKGVLLVKDRTENYWW
jgi:hypothetical protein